MGVLTAARAMLIAALWSACMLKPQLVHTNSACDRRLALSTWPQQEHFLLVFRGSTA